MLEQYNGKYFCQVVNMQRMYEPGAHLCNTANTDFAYLADSMKEAEDIFNEYVKNDPRYKNNKGARLNMVPLVNHLASLTYSGKQYLKKS